jgi:DNA repair exonuclease SbcCD ATPase subunit
MILRSLKVERFGGLNPGAFVEGFGPDVTVIHGPNGIGKSTLFRALTYALYQRHGVAAQDALAQIVPRGCDVAPRVEVTFDVQDGTWRLAKQFVRKPDTELFRLEKGVFVPKAQGSAAEDLLRDLLGSGRNQKGLAGAQFRGIGEILLVDQGGIRMTEGVSQFARDRLRLVVDQVATTQGAHELLAAVEKRYAEVFGKSGDLRERSVASQLDEEVRRLDASVAEARAQIALAEDLGQRLAALAGESPARVQEEIARVDRELETARARKLEVVRRRVQRDALAKDSLSLAEEGERLRSVCADLALQRATVDRLAKTIAAGESRRQDLAEEHGRALAAERAAEADLSSALLHDRTIADRERSVREARKAFEVAAALPDLEDRVARYDGARARIGEAEARSAARLRPTQKEMIEVRAAFQALRDLERAVEVLDFRVEVTAESPLTIECGAERIALGPNEVREIVSDGSAELRIPGIARLGIRAPGGLERTRILRELDSARHAAEDLGTRFGAADLEGLETLARERIEIEAGLRALIAGRDSVFKDPSKAEAARVDLNAAAASLKELIEKHAEWRGVVPDVGAIEREEHDLEKERQHAGDVQSACARLLDARREHAKRVGEDLKRHDETLEASKRDLAGATGRIAALESDRLSDEDRTKRAAEVEARRTDVARELAETTEALDTLGDPDATIGRLVAERREIEAQEKLAEEKRIRLGEQLDQLRAKGLWQALADLEIERLRKGEELERERLAADALKLLRDVLVREQAAAVEAAVRPVAERVTRMARFLFGAGSRATFNEQLAPQALASEGCDLPVGLLSAGTQDQIALLARIALGELYAEKQGRHAFVLDDPLVNCDRERRSRILELLASSRSLQVVIFTCSPELYRFPDGKAVFVSMEDAKGRLAHASSLSA